jgi:octaprenyl-diphosphate synthase
VNENGGIEYAREKMVLYHDKAMQILEEFPDSEAKTALKQLVDFTIERKK